MQRWTIVKVLGGVKRGEFEHLLNVGRRDWMRTPEQWWTEIAKAEPQHQLETIHCLEKVGDHTVKLQESL